MIKLSLISKTTTVVIPVNTDELKISRKSDNKTATIVGTGEIVIPGKIGLMSFAIDGFAWDSTTISYGGGIWFNDELSPVQFVNAIHRMQAEQKPGNPLKFVAEGLGIDMYVLIQSFDSSVRAGAEKDRYYSISFTEYRPYGAQPVEVKQVAVEKPPQEAQTAARNITIEELSIGQIVDFIGGYHYASSTATSSPNKTPRTAGQATLTSKAKGKTHPLHLIGVAGGSNVYGWVDLNTVSGVSTVSTNTSAKIPAPPRVTQKKETTEVAPFLKFNKSQVTYITTVGDSLLKIAKLLGTSATELYKANKSVFIKNPNATIPAGTVLNIPESGVGYTPSAY